MGLNPTAVETILHHLREELQRIRSGRASPALIEATPVEAYGSRLTLRELATITTPESRALLVQPWDQNVLKDVERGLRQAYPELNPVVDRDRIRISLPSLTEERRREYLKLSRERVERSRIALRRLRDETLKDVRAGQRDGSLSEDAAERERQAVEQTVAKANQEIRDLSQQKEQELMSV